MQVDVNCQLYRNIQVVLILYGHHSKSLLCGWSNIFTLRALTTFPNCIWSPAFEILTGKGFISTIVSTRNTDSDFTNLWANN